MSFGASLYVFIRSRMELVFGESSSASGGIMSVVIALAASFVASVLLYGLFFTKKDEESGGSRGVRTRREEEERRQLEELRRQRQQRQQQRAGAAHGASVSETESGISTTTTTTTTTAVTNDVGANDGTDAIVAKLFCGARIVTVSANEVLFTRASDGSFKLKPAAVSVIASLSRQIRGGLFIVSKVENDDEEEALRQLLSVDSGGSATTRTSGVESAGHSAGATSSSGSKHLLVEDHKLLFCGTDIGKTAIVRCVRILTHMHM